jgi:hypothetical protein
MSSFKILVVYDRNINDVAIHVDKDTAKDLVIYLLRSVLMDFEYKDGNEKVIGCTNSVAVEAACGNEHSQHLMDIRNKLINLIEKGMR